MVRVIAPHDRSAVPAAVSTARTDAETAAGTAGSADVPSELPRPRRTTTPAAAPAAAAVLAARSASAVTLAGFRSPMIAETERLQFGIRDQFVAPLKSAIDQVLRTSRWVQQQDRLWRSVFAVPSFAMASLAVPSLAVPWWTYTDLWPTDGLMASLMRPLDIARPQLLDLSRTLDNILGSTGWIGQLNAGLWRELRHVGQAIAFWAVRGARAALERGDIPALEQFVRDWLEATPTRPRVEAVVEALLEIDPAQYAPDEGACLLDDLRARVRELTTDRRREHETLLGLRRGTGPIARITDPEAIVLSRPGLRTGPSLEDSVLDRFQPEVDPRLIEQVKELPLADQKIVVMKTVTGCAWDAAAVTCGHMARYGEVLRRRLHRRRDRLLPSTDPWSEITPATMTTRERAAFGRIHPSTIIADVTGGIWP